MQQAKNNKKDQRLSRQELKQKCAEYLLGWQRAQADYQNLERQIVEQKKEWIKMSNADLLAEILPIYDNLKLALAHIPREAKKTDWVAGIGHIKSQFEKFLADNGIEEIKSIGENFNPELHEAVESGAKEDGRQAAKGEKDNLIKKEIKAGYKLNGRVIYPAKVVV